MKTDFEQYNIHKNYDYTWGQINNTESIFNRTNLSH